MTQRWLKPVAVSLFACALAAWTAPHVIRRFDPPAGIPVLHRTVESYVKNHHAEFLGVAQAAANWKTSADAPEAPVDIPDEVLHGQGACSLASPVTITPARNTKLLKHRRNGNINDESHLDDPKAKDGVIVARIYNPNDCTTAPVAFQKGTYYWIVRGVGTGANRTYESVFVHEDALDDALIKAQFTRCNNPDHPQSDDSADAFIIKDVCSDGITSTVPRSAKARAQYTEKLRALIATATKQRGVRPNIGRKRFDGDDIALWFACDQGCCYASGF
jgi:hypothetical protein